MYHIMSTTNLTLRISKNIMQIFMSNRPEPDPAKLYESDRIRIHNTGKILFLERGWIGQNERCLLPIRIRIYELIPIQIRIRMGIKRMPIHMLILPKVLHNKGENFFTFIQSNASLQWYSFVKSGKCVMILGILDSLVKFSGEKKKKHMCFELRYADRPDPAKLCGSTFHNTA